MPYHLTEMNTVVECETKGPCGERTHYWFSYPEEMEDLNIILSTVRDLADDPEVQAQLVIDNWENEVIQASLFKIDEDEPYLVLNTNNPYLLSFLANEPEDWVRWQVAQNPNTPPAVLTRLAEDSIVFVRFWVADNPNTPPATLARLAEDKKWIVRLQAANNPKTPHSALLKLAAVKRRRVRCEIAYNRNAPAEVLVKFLGDEVPVRGRVVKNPSSPNGEEILLTKDQSEWVREATQEALKETYL